MAWDALAGQFKKKEDKDSADVRGERASFGSIGGAGTGSAPQAQPLGGFGGTAGSGGDTGSSRFVNYGTLYGLNEEKAKGMANNVYRGAEKKAEDAKGSLANAQTQFQDKANAGAGGSRPIGGAHGTRIETGVAPDAEPEDSKPVAGGKKSANITAAPDPWAGPLHSEPWTGPANRLDSVGTGGSFVTDNSAQLSDDEKAARGRGTAAGNVLGGRYASLYGQPTTLDEQRFLAGEEPGGYLGAARAPDESGRADYHHSVRPGEAKTGSEQDYTGPDSLKDSMGEEGYGSLAEELRKADEAVKGTADAGGIAEALGYTGGVQGSGMAAMDAGLAQTAGQSNFAKLRERYGGLGKLLPTAQSDSLATVGRAEAASDSAAADWDKMLAEYEAQNKPAAEKEKTPYEQQRDTVSDMRDWAYFTQGGRTDSADSAARDAASGLNLQQKDAFKTLTDMGYSNDVIRAAWDKWRAAGNKNWPTASQLAAIILSGGA
jgi:hypothetical protein